MHILSWWPEHLVPLSPQLGGLVTQRLEEVMARLGGAEAGDTRDLGLGLGWRSDKEQFCRAQRDNIGHFTDRV